MISVEISNDNLINLFGAFDCNARYVEEALSVRLIPCDGELKIEGKDEISEQRAEQLFVQLIRLIGMGFSVDEDKIRESVDLVLMDRPDDIVELSTHAVAVTAKGKAVYCKTIGQRHYVKMIGKKEVVVGVGPAGTGKTFLAVAMAVKEYKAGNVDKIILTRPAVEVGEKLGFLPGDLQDKVDPYLRPLYDALETMFGDTYAKLIERGVVEVAPLAYMRGRTLSNAFIILDEAQNTTNEQMKMFLTRMGENSRMVVTGDLTQTDLPLGSTRGLPIALDVLRDVEEIAICRLNEKDVVRHKLVRKIVNAYEKSEKKQ